MTNKTRRARTQASVRAHSARALFLFIYVMSTSREATAAARARNGVAAVARDGADLSVESARSSIRKIGAAIVGGARIGDAAIGLDRSVAHALRRARSLYARETWTAVGCGRAGASRRNAGICSSAEVVDAWVATAVGARRADGSSAWRHAAIGARAVDGLDETTRNTESVLVAAVLGVAVAVVAVERRMLAAVVLCAARVTIARFADASWLATRSAVVATTELARWRCLRARDRTVDRLRCAGPSAAIAVGSAHFAGWLAARWRLTHLEARGRAEESTGA
jgi:hypothetical protein